MQSVWFNLKEIVDIITKHSECTWSEVEKNVCKIKRRNYKRTHILCMTEVWLRFLSSSLFSARNSSKTCIELSEDSSWLDLLTFVWKRMKKKSQINCQYLEVQKCNLFISKQNKRNKSVLLYTINRSKQKTWLIKQMHLQTCTAKSLHTCK